MVDDLLHSDRNIRREDIGSLACNRLYGFGTGNVCSVLISAVVVAFLLRANLDSIHK